MYRGHIQRARKRRVVADALAGGKFIYAPPPPTEAGADENTFVCEFNGGLWANEVGVGGGLSAADRTLTQVGGVAAAVNGWRTMTAANQRFTATTGLLNWAFQSSAGWSLLLKCRNADYTAGMDNLFYVGGANAGDYMFAGDSLDTAGELSLNMDQASPKRVVRGNITGAVGDTLLNDTEFYILMCSNVGDDLCVAGIALGSAPTSLADFDILQVSPFALSPSTDFSSVYQAIIGYNSAFDAGAVVLTNYPMVTRNS